MTNEERKAALEAIIYAADEPATIDQLSMALGEKEKLVVQASLDELVASYAVEERGIEIRCVAGGYKLYTKPQQHDVVRRFIKSLRPALRLTMPALETLAVIAYKQPVTAPEISEIRGVNTSGVISTLLDKRLITTAGRKEVIGRPILYKTSKEFLMRFGLSDLEELPSLKEFEALAREALGSEEGVAPGEATTDERAVARRSAGPASGEWPAEGVAPGEAATDERAVARRSAGQASGEWPATAGEPFDSEDKQVASENSRDGTAPSSENGGSGSASVGAGVGEGATGETPRNGIDGGEAAGDEHTHETIGEAVEHVGQELAEAEAFREHEALATAEGMPAGELDEDPPPPSVKSTAVGE